MTDTIRIHIALSLICLVYTLVMNRPRIYAWLVPYHIWEGVVGGYVLIMAAQIVLYYVGVTLTPLLLLTTGLSGGGWFILWQIRKVWQKRRALRQRLGR